MRSMCTFDECEKRQVAKSLCDGHYRQLKSGKPLAPLRGGKPKPCKTAISAWRRENMPGSTSDQ